MRQKLALCLVLLLPVTGCAAFLDALRDQQERNAPETAPQPLPADDLSPSQDGADGTVPEKAPEPEKKTGPIISDATISAAGALANSMGASGLGMPIASGVGFVVNMLGSLIVGKP